MTKPGQILFAEFVRSAASSSGFPQDGFPEVALLGRSNVGKSSLLNRLAGVKGLAAVSRTPGRTRLVNFFRMEERFYLVDLPGYGFAKVPERVRERWEGLVSSYLFGRRELRLSLLVVDARHEAMRSDLEARDLLAGSRMAFAVVATKSDKLSRAALVRKRARLEETLAAAGRVPLITFSAVTGEGRKELWNVIETHVREAS